MKVIRNLEQNFFENNQNLFCTLGNFDGVHLGHQKILKKTKEIALRKNLFSAVITYHPNPSSVLVEDSSFKYLISIEEKIELIEKFDIDFLFIIDFTKKFSRKTAESFLEILIYNFRCKGILLGFDHSFGKNKKGNFEFLKKNQSKYGYFLYQVPAVFFEKSIVSSSVIKNLIHQGEIEKANQMLGKHYFITGTVRRGLQDGRKLSFPTINLIQDETFVNLSKGVYAGKVFIKRKKWDCMINVGTKPTFGDNHQTLIEAHIFNFKDNIYNQEVKIFFHHKIREEIKFATKADLKEQLIKDQQKSLQLLN